MNNKSDGNIVEILKKLENRVSRIESRLEILNQSEPIIQESTNNNMVITGDQESLEFQIGEFWLARVGIVALAIGIIFLLTFPYQGLPAILPSTFGYALSLGIFVLSYYWRESFSYISRYLLGGGLVLLFFSTMRLYFFSPQPVVTNMTFEALFLLLIVIINLFVSVRRKSVYLVSINLLLGYVAAIVTTQPYFIFISITVLSAMAVYFKNKYAWRDFILLIIVFSYITHFIWFINIPFMGNKIQLMSIPQINILFLLLYFLIFAAGNYLRDKTIPEDTFLIVNTIINCLGCYVLYLIITITTIKEQIPFYHIIASFTFLITAILFWQKEKSKYSTFFYSILGFIAMSVAIISGFDNPDFFILLSWQSLIVVMAALLFRSKIIIIANFFIYLTIFITYLFATEEATFASFSFGLIALLSARIMNWQKVRLEIKTELIRNIYLASAFIAFPYTLYKLVPVQYISLSWMGIALVYYLLSLLLKNIKYRWMALFTLFLSVLYLFIIDIVKLDPVYRIISFLVLGIVLIVISVAYTKIKSKGKSTAGQKS